MQNKKYLKPSEVSDQLRVSLSLVYKEIRLGNLVAHRFGRRAYRISEEDLRRYAAERSSDTSGRTEARPKLKKTAPSKFKHLDVSQLLSSRN